MKSLEACECNDSRLKFKNERGERERGQFKRGEERE